MDKEKLCNMCKHSRPVNLPGYSKGFAVGSITTTVLFVITNIIRSWL